MKTAALLLVSLAATVSTPSSAADLALGKYTETSAHRDGPSYITIQSVQDNAVAATFWWPYKKKSSSTCGGEHPLAGTLDGSHLELSDPPGQAMLGCEVVLILEQAGAGLKGTLNGRQREFLPDS